MKKITITMILVLTSILISAQEKGSYISLTLGGGFTGFDYTLQGINPGTEDGTNKHLLGGASKIEYSYYFTRHWGLSLGAGFSYYRSEGRYKGVKEENKFNLGHQLDTDLTGVNNYNLLVRLYNWEERQKGYIIDIPLMVKFQHKFGERQKHGIYAGIGAKAQIPIKTKYFINGSDFTDLRDRDNWRLSVSGDYYDKNLELGDPFADSYVSPATGFGILTNTDGLGWEDEFKMDISWSGTLEAGFLFGVSRRVDLTVGGYFDYGFNNLKKNNGRFDPLLEAPEHYLPDASNNVGHGIVYNGMLNSDKVEKYHLISYGVTLGLRVKLGKLHNPDPFDDEYFANKAAEEAEAAKEPAAPPVDTKGIEDGLDRIEKLMREMLEQQQRPNEEIQILKEKLDTVYSTMFEDGLNEAERNMMLERIYFDFGKYKLKDESKEVLDRKAEILKDNPRLRLRIIGNTCDISGDNINIPLGMNRSNAAKQYLINKGIDGNRLVTATQASNDPAAPNDSEENRKLNRRCDFEIVIF